MLKALLPVIEIIGRILSDMLIAWASSPKWKADNNADATLPTGVSSDIDDVADRLRITGD